MKSETKPKSKKWGEMTKKEKRRGCIGSIIILVVIFFIFKSCFSSPDVMYPPKHLYEMSKSEKQDWFLKFKDDNNDRVTSIDVGVQNALKNKFEFPDEVKFKHWIVLPNASSYIVYDSSVVVIFNGDLSAKNRLGNDMMYHYSAAVKIYDSTQEIIKADIY